MDTYVHNKGKRAEGPKENREEEGRRRERAGDWAARKRARQPHFTTQQQGGGGVLPFGGVPMAGTAPSFSSQALYCHLRRRGNPCAGQDRDAVESTACNLEPATCGLVARRKPMPKGTRQNFNLGVCSWPPRRPLRCGAGSPKKKLKRRQGGPSQSARYQVQCGFANPSWHTGRAH